VSAASVCEREHLSESVRVLRQHCILRWAMNKVVCKFMEVFQCFCWTEQNVDLAKLVNLLALHAFFFFFFVSKTGQCTPRSQSMSVVKSFSTIRLHV
jgi:hypothetical protein